MLESLYSKAIEKKETISKQILDYEKQDLDVFKLWNNEKIAKIPNDLIIAAGDGSKNTKKFLSFYFYAISAVSLVYDKTLRKVESSEINTTQDPNKTLKKVQSSDINIIPNSRFASDRIRNYMGLFEVKNALKTIENYDVDYYLYDGSLLGDLIRPYPLDKNIPQDIRFKIIEIAKNELNKEIEKLNVEVSSEKIAKNSLKEEFESIKNYDPFSYLENIEKLLVLSKLLKHNKKLIAISKTSSSTDYFNSAIPDIAIFDNFSQDTGFSKPYLKPTSREVKHEFPVEDAFFKSLKFTIFYLRLEKNKNILKIELPYKANQKEINNIIAILAENSTEGYPYLLKKAHHDVIIKDKDIGQLSKILELYGKSGREML